MNGASFPLSLAVGGQVRRFDVGAAEPVRIGFLTPLSGAAESWGLPGVMGARIWVDWINRAGGLMLGGRRHPVELVEYDCAAGSTAAIAGARALVQDQGVKFLLMLGGDTLRPIARYLTDRKILTSTLLPSDLSPDAPYLIAPSENYPLYHVTAVDWLANNRPELERVALCSQTDVLGLSALATYRAAFRATNRSVVREILYDPDETGVEAMVAAMLESDPDILCLGSSYTPMVHALTEEAHRAGFRGQILSSTADYYPRLVARTSEAFMEGFLFQFPDFDDPALRDRPFFFNRPAAFYEEYNRRFPGTWSAVSWEYVAALDIWHAAVEEAGSVAPVSVLAAMRRAGRVETVFGEASWSGADLFGIDNALVGSWPVVRITGGRARIVEFGSIPDWLARHGDLLRKEMQALGQMWYQRQGKAAPVALSSGRS